MAFFPLFVVYKMEKIHEETPAPRAREGELFEGMWVPATERDRTLGVD